MTCPENSPAFHDLEMLKSMKKFTYIGLPDAISAELLSFIRNQKLSKGDRLPSQRELAKRLNVSLASLREALARLEALGLVRQVHGAGTFVGEDSNIVRTSIDVNISLTEMILSQGMRPGTRDVQIISERPPKHVADCLHIDESTDLIRFSRVRTADNTNFAYSIAYLSPQFHEVCGALDGYGGSLYEFMQIRCGEFITDCDAIIEAAIADELVAKKLDLEVGEPLIVLHQCHYNEEGKALIYSTEFFVQNKLEVHFRRRRVGY